MFDIANGPGTGGRMDQPIYSEKRRDRLTMDFIRPVDHTLEKILTRNPNASDKTIDNLLETILGVGQFDWLRQGLGQINPLKGNYTFGKEGNVNVRHNLLNELVNRITEKIYFDRYEDMQPELKIGTQFGKDNKAYTDLTVNPKSIGFDIGVNF